jgi:hypothetical protein
MCIRDSVGSEMCIRDRRMGTGDRCGDRGWREAVRG